MRSKFYGFVSGYTLVELLVVLGLMALISVAATNALYSLLSGTAKSQNLLEVKQNGDYAVSVMQVKIRNALDAYQTLDSLCGGSPTDSITIDNQDGNTTTFACSSRQITQQNEGGPISNLTSSSVQVTPTSCAAIFTCTSDTGPRRITINFTLAQTGGPIKEGSTQVFKTIVALRN